MIMVLKLKQSVFLFLILLITLKLYYQKEQPFLITSSSNNPIKILTVLQKSNIITTNKHITIENYFQYIDSLVVKYDSLTPYLLTEHLLVRANPWIIDTLQNTDYYRMKARDSFIYNQKKMIALPKGSSIIIPDHKSAKKIKNYFKNTHIYVNIPEYKLRIIEDSVVIYEFLVRVGRNEKKYLEMSGRIQDLRTKTGTGKIVTHFKNPKYINPVNNHKYGVTKRDDNLVTKLPKIPSIETEINGLRYGQLIHTTTNPVTLGKAYSNGCIGTKEADAWVIYYYTPINTKIQIRYDLNVLDDYGNTIVLKDIYNKRK
jgi:L,D-transpeptidase ErfK/SrfK